MNKDWKLLRKRLWPWLTLLLVLLLFRWIFSVSLEYALSNYMHQQLQPTPETRVTYDIQGMDIHWLDLRLTLHDISASIEQKDDQEGTTFYDLNLPSFSIDLFSSSALIFRQTLDIDEFRLDNPRLDILSPKPAEAEPFHQEAGDLHQKTLQFLKEMDFRHFEVNHARVSWRTEGMSKPRYQLNDVSIRMDDLDIRMDALNTEGVAQYLLASHFDVLLQNDDFLMPDGRHQLHFGRLRISNENGIRIDSLKLTEPLRGEPGTYTSQADHLTLPYLSLTGLDFAALYNKNILLADSVILGKTDLHFCLDQQKLSLFEQEAEEPTHTLDEIRIGHLQLSPSRIHLRQASQSLSNTIDVDNAALLLEQVSHTADDREGFSWAAQNLELHLQGYQTKLEGLNFAVGFDQLNWSFEEKSFGLENLEIVSLSDTLPADKMGPPRFVRIPSFQIKDLDFEELFAHRRLTGGSILIKQPELTLNLPRPANQQKQEQPDLSVLLAHFISDLQLDQWELHEGKVQLYSHEPDMQISLDGLGIIGDSWTWRAGESLPGVSMEALIGQGSLKRDDLQVNFRDAAFSTLSDQLDIQSASIGLHGSKTKLHGKLEIQDVRVAGLMQFDDSHTLPSVNLGKLKASLHLPEKSASEQKEHQLLLAIEHLHLDQMEAEVFSSQHDTIRIQNASADLRDIQMNPESEAMLPFSWDMKQSMVQITEASLANASISASVESLLLSNDQLSLHQLQASSRKSDNRWQIHLPAFSLEGVQVPQNKEAAFSIRKAVVQQPRSSFSWNAAPHKKAHNQPKVSSGLAVKLDTLLINDAQWEFAQSKNGVSQQWESANTSISALDLAYPFEMDELLEQQIDLSLKDVQHQSEQAQFTIASLDVSVRDQQLDIRDVDFTINQNLHDALARIHGEIPSLLLRTSLPAGWQPSQEWRIRDFLISSPQLMVNYRKQAADKASKPQKAAGTGTHPSLLVENLNIKDLGISLEADAQETTLALEGLDFSYQDLQWEQDQPIGIETLTSHSDWQLELNHFYAGFAAPRQEAHMFGLKLNPVTESLAWDSSRVAPKASPLEFSQLIDFQKSWISVNTGKGAISGLDLNKLSKGEIHAPRVKIQRPRLEVFRDKRLPFPENHYPPMLHKALAEARIPISIDTVELNDARIHVNIQPPRGEQLASIRFTNAEVYLTNVTNLPEEIKLDHLLKAQAYAKIQDAALLQAKMEFDLNHPAYPFFIEAELGKMDLRELNSLTEPIASVRIRKGVMRRMNFQALANEDFAYGNMDFMYRRLNIQMLSKKHPERQGLGLAVESFLANRLILRKNNDYPFPHRQGQLYVERDDTRSVFNYFAKIALNGILSSAGVKSNRKALHKEYKSRREQYLENQQNPMGVTSLPE